MRTGEGHFSCRLTCPRVGRLLIEGLFLHDKYFQSFLISCSYADLCDGITIHPTFVLCFFNQSVRACVFPQFPWTQIITCTYLSVACLLHLLASGNVFRLAACCFFFSLLQVSFCIHSTFADRLGDYCGFSVTTVVRKPCSVMTGRTNVGHCKPNRFFDCAIFCIRVPLIRDQCFEEEIY